jgi:uncharacterized protein YcbK (DUF882 family)
MHKNGSAVNRREILKAGLVAGTALIGSAAAGTAQATSLMFERKGSFNINFRNVHTGEKFEGVYRVGDRYLPEAFDRINHVLRDFRTGEEFPIDPRVIDMMYMLRHETELKDKRFDVLSGYRSPKTNAKLRKASTGVAKRSLHMTGQAIDLRLPGYDTYQLRKIAVGMKAGGVGYYRGSDFVHMDSGRVRTW